MKIQTKKCKDCGEIKNLEKGFSKRKSSIDGHQYICKECSKKQSKQWRQDNKERVKEYEAKYHQDNKERRNEYGAQWRQDNPEYSTQWSNKKYHSDPMYRMKQNLRSRTNMAFKSKGWSKDSLTHDMLGCDWETAVNHIQSQFTDGMSWDNKGEWHDDHIIPLDCARTEEEMKKLCHYTNLQPLWAGDNMSKGNNVLTEHYDLHYKLLGRKY